MDGDVDDVAGGRGVHKTRLKHLLSHQVLVNRILAAVETMHEVTSRALVFGKQLYLADLDAAAAANGGVFDATVAGRMAAEFPVDAGQIEDWMNVVSGGLVGRVGPPYAPEKALRLRRLHDFYDACASAGLLPTVKLPCTNLSVPKGYAADQLATNYKNNIFCHFDKYVKRLVRTRLTSAARTEHGLAAADKLALKANPIEYLDQSEVDTPIKFEICCRTRHL